MNIKKLQTIIIDALEDVKAVDIALFDTSKLTSMFDRLIIASGTSNRQTKALAASVRDKVRQAGGTVVGMEGEDAGEWVLVDLGDIVVHLMQPPIRAYYQLEEIWGDKKIDLEKAKEATKSKTATVKPTEKITTPKKRATSVRKATSSAGEKPKKVKKSVTASTKSAATRKKTTESNKAAPKKTGTRKKTAE